MASPQDKTPSLDRSSILCTRPRQGRRPDAGGAPLGSLGSFSGFRAQGFCFLNAFFLPQHSESALAEGLRPATSSPPRRLCSAIPIHHRTSKKLTVLSERPMSDPPPELSARPRASEAERAPSEFTNDRLRFQSLRYADIHFVYTRT